MQTETRPAPINLTAFINEAPFSRYQKLVIGTCFLLMALDTIDLALISFAAPAIASAWSIPIARFGTIFGIGLAGSLFGSLLFGSAADVLGRRLPIIIGAAVFGLFTLLLPTVHSLEGLLIMRFLCGLGIGGVQPNCIALSSEFAPPRLRPTVVSITSCGLPLGSALAGMIALLMLPAYGWKSMFYLGGVMPLVLLPILVWFLPESIRFLAVKKNGSSKLAEILNKIAPMRKVADTDSFILGEQRVAGSPAKALFTDGRLPTTLLLWLMFIIGYLITFLLLNWLPALLQQSGIPLTRAILVASIFSLGGPIGGMVFAWFSKRSDSRRVMVIGFVAAAGSIIILGMSQGHAAMVVISIFLSGFFVTGTQITMYVTAAAAYRTTMRSTGIGWAAGIGRIGSIIGPVVAGVLLGTGTTVSQLIYITAAPALIGSAAAFLLAREQEEGIEVVAGRMENR